MNFKPFSTTCIGLLVALGSTGCPQRPQAPLPAPAPATVTRFAVDPSVLTAPGSVSLEWGTTDATDVTIEQVGKGPVDLGSDKTGGRIGVSVDEDTVFLITAQGAGGSDIKATSVTVQARATSVLFSAVPSTIEAGGTTTLVWNAPGARSVSLSEVSGATIDVGTQLESGSVRVVPKKTTTYQLRADDKVATTTVSVAPTILSFGSEGASPAPGQPVVLTWQTSSATTVTLTRVGLGTPLTVGADQIATGRATDTVPAALPADGVLTYVLTASDGTTSTSKSLEVSVGGGVQITRFIVPTYALTGTTFTVAWTSVGGESAELVIDGRRAWQAQSRAEVASGSYTLSAPTQSTRVELIVRNARGALARESATIEGVGPIAYNSFTSDKTSIVAAGEPVTLRWSVANARAVRITSNSGAGFYRQFTGVVETGSLVVLPNSRPPSLTRITYRLEADNGTGSPPVSATLDVTVGSPAAFTFSRQLPVRAPSTVTGSTAAGTTQVAGFANVEKNPAGEAFVDIRRTGTAVSFGTANAVNLALPAPFPATLYGTRTAGTRLNISRYGWFNLGTSTAAVPGRPDNDLTLGTALEPLSIAPYWNNLVVADGQVTWRLDGVADARRLIVQWTNVRPTNGPIDARMTFQAQVHSNGRVVFAYRDFLKLTGRGTIGAVNFSESDESGPTTAIADGDVYRLFGPQAPPAPLRIEATPYAGLSIVNGVTMETEGLANYPLNQFVISEISRQPPAAVTNGQWLEIANNADSGVDIGGWDLDFGGSSTFQFPAGTILPASGRLLVGQAADVGDPGPAAFVTVDGGTEPRVGVGVLLPSTFTMPSTSGFARLGIGGTEYTRFAFPAASTGLSYGLEDQRAPWLLFANNTRIICESVRYAYGTNGQKGSPGVPNPPCWPYEPYEVIPGAFTPLTGDPAATVINFGITNPDTNAVALDLTTAGRSRVSVFGLTGGVGTMLVAADGYLVVGGSTQCCDNTALPSTSNRLWLAPFWDDLQGQPGGAVLFKQTGTPPNVTTIISWERWSFWPADAASTFTGGPPPYTGTTISFQVQFKPNGDIEYHYGPSTVGAGTDAAALVQGSSVSVWIEAVSAADAYANRITDAVVPTRNLIFNGLGIRYRTLRP